MNNKTVRIYPEQFCESQSTHHRNKKQQYKQNKVLKISPPSLGKNPVFSWAFEGIWIQGQDFEKLMF